MNSLYSVTSLIFTLQSQFYQRTIRNIPHLIVCCNNYPVIHEKLLNDKLSTNLGYLYENVVAQILAAQGNELF